MRKAGSLKLATALTTIAVALFVVASVLVSAIGNRKVHAAGRFKLELKSTYGYTPYLYGNTLTGISNFLSSPENRLILATTSKTDEKHFEFDGGFGFRSTSLSYVHYSGADSNAVQLVASNAANMVILFLATNQPAWEVSYIDSYCFSPAPPWQWLENIWSHFRYTYLK